MDMLYQVFLSNTKNLWSQDPMVLWLMYLIVNKFKHQLPYYVPFWTNTLWKRYEPLYPTQLWIK